MKKDWSQLKEKIENLRQIEDIWKIVGILAVTLILFGTGLPVSQVLSLTLEPDW